MKRILLLFLAVAIGSLSYSQKIITFSDDFESYSNNAWLAQNSNIWDTWSGAPSTNGDDVRVTNNDAFSGSKSIYFSPGPGAEDVVLPFGAVHRNGQFYFRQMMKIPKLKTAYFNFQGDASVASTWAVEVTFGRDSIITFSNQGTGTMFTTSYPQNRWFEIYLYLDLSHNEWHVYVNGEHRGRFLNSVNRASFLDYIQLTPHLPSG